MSTITESIEQTIATIAARRLGAADVTIVPVFERDHDELVGGRWFSLSIKLPGDVEWKPLGRRRTKAELLTLVGTLDPQHVGGKCFVATKRRAANVRPAV